jgi:hypothetical protein
VSKITTMQGLLHKIAGNAGIFAAGFPVCEPAM